MSQQPQQPGHKGTVLILSQVYIPDPAAVGQHMADAAANLAQRGRRVVVLTSANGYNDPSIKYPKRETIDNVNVVRLGLSSFGKANLLTRILGAVLFMLQSMFKGLFIKDLDTIVVSTSPPMCIFAALFITTLRPKTKVCFWVMDINPEQLISLNKVKTGSLPANILNTLNKRMLKKADATVVLDRFMADTMRQKHDPGDRLAIIPPWPPADFESPVEHQDNHFRDQHNIQDKFVVMYSGNHGLFLPLDALINAAIKMKDDPSVVFMFIGDGARKRDVESAIENHNLTNVRSLPYQPIETLRYSLSAADLHAVTIADDMVGIIHPCKVYGAMAVARPLLLVGPNPCHVSDLIHEHDLGWHTPNSDADAVVNAIKDAQAMPPEQRAAMGNRARHLVTTSLNLNTLCTRFADIVDDPTRSNTLQTAPATTQSAA